MYGIQKFYRKGENDVEIVFVAHKITKMEHHQMEGTIINGRTVTAFKKRTVYVFEDAGVEFKTYSEAEEYITRELSK